jgi:hypothetical protein
MCLFFILGLTSVYIALNGYGIGGGYVVPASAQLGVKYFGYIAFQRVHMPDRCSF